MVLRVPEVFVQELLRVVRVLDEREKLSVTGNDGLAADTHVTGDLIVNEAVLKEAADTFILTMPQYDL